jgi:hypothetical protein
VTKEIKIFKSFEEQELYQLNKARQTTVEQRFLNLRYMQNFAKKTSSISKERKIIITYGFITS